MERPQKVFKTNEQAKEWVRNYLFYIPKDLWIVLVSRYTIWDIGDIEILCKVNQFFMNSCDQFYTKIWERQAGIQATLDFDRLISEKIGKPVKPKIKLLAWRFAYRALSFEDQEKDQFELRNADGAGIVFSYKNNILKIVDKRVIIGFRISYVVPELTKKLSLYADGERVHKEDYDYDYRLENMGQEKLQKLIFLLFCDISTQGQITFRIIDKTIFKQDEFRMGEPIESFVLKC